MYVVAKLRLRCRVVIASSRHHGIERRLATQSCLGLTDGYHINYSDFPRIRPDSFLPNFKSNFTFVT